MKKKTGEEFALTNGQIVFFRLQKKNALPTVKKLRRSYDEKNNARPDSVGTN
jgi:hypothetical protein